MSDLDLMRGTLDVLVLKTLTGGPMHGYAVARWIKSASDDALLVEEGALYPALHRLERKGWVEAEWGLSEKNRKAKFYTITAEGAEHVRREEESWSEYVDVVGRIISAAEGATS
jgi:PadR family transcriptional regulator PadR